MKTKNLAVLLIILICLGVLGLTALMPHIVVCAEEINPSLVITNPKSDGGSSGNLAGLCAQINTDLHENRLFTKGIGKNLTYTDFLFYEEGKLNDVIVSKITLNMNDYKKLNQELKTEVYDIVLNSIAESQLLQENKTKLYNFVVTQDSTISSLVSQLSKDVKADIYGAFVLIIRKLLWILRFLLGVIVIGMTILLSFTLIFDLAYLIIPAVNMFFTDLQEKKFKGKRHIKIVSLEAEKAYQMSCASNGMSFINAVGAYFSMKSKSLVVLFICLLYISSGDFFTLIMRFIDLFSGFLPK